MESFVGVENTWLHGTSFVGVEIITSFEVSLCAGAAAKIFIKLRKQADLYCNNQNNIKHQQ